MTSDRRNRRDELIDTAADLFQENGYNATTVRQIAEAVGVTEAALYYHFKDGKRELLQSVIEQHMPTICINTAAYEDAKTLREFVLRLAEEQNNPHNRRNVGRLRWVLAEFPKFSAEEQALFHAMAHHAHEQAREIVLRYVPDRARAAQIAWFLLVAFFGYGQLFLNLGMAAQATEFDGPVFIQIMAEMLGGLEDAAQS